MYRNCMSPFFLKKKNITDLKDTLVQEGESKTSFPKLAETEFGIFRNLTALSYGCRPT